jgi:hypothetical protein
MFPESHFLNATLFFKAAAIIRSSAFNNQSSDRDCRSS